MAPLAPALASFASSLLDRWSITACSISLNDGQEQGFGLATPETVFCICSNTKQFTSVCLGLLVQQGKLRWDSKIKDILLDFELQNKHTRDNVTVEDILAHLGGLKPALHGYSNSATHADIVREMENLQFNQQKLRQSYVYSNYGYTLAGHLIQVLTGQKYADFVTNKILKPLEMSNSSFDVSIWEDKGTKCCATLDDGTVYEISNAFGDCQDDNGSQAAGGLFSTSADLIKWLGYLSRVYEQKLQPEDPAIISHQTLWDILGPRTTAFQQLGLYSPKAGESLFPEFSAPMYALGLQRFSIHGIEIVCHMGGFPGYGSLTLWTPGRDFSITMVYNDERRGAVASSIIALKAFELHFGISEIDWEKRFTKRGLLQTTGPAPMPVVCDVVAPRIHTQDLLGVYSAAGLGKIHVFHPSTRGDGLPQHVVDVLSVIQGTKAVGRARPDPLLVGVFEEDLLLDTYLAIFHVSKDVYVAESHKVFKKSTDVSLNMFRDSNAYLLSFTKTEGKMFFDFYRNCTDGISADEWEKAISEEGDLVFVRL